MLLLLLLLLLLLIGIVAVLERLHPLAGSRSRPTPAPERATSSAAVALGALRSERAAALYDGFLPHERSLFSCDRRAPRWRPRGFSVRGGKPGKVRLKPR